MTDHMIRQLLLPLGNKHNQHSDMKKINQVPVSVSALYRCTIQLIESVWFLQVCLSWLITLDFLLAV